MNRVHVNMMTLFISEPQKGSETSCEYAGQSSKCSSRIGRMSKTALFFCRCEVTDNARTLCSLF